MSSCVFMRLYKRYVDNIFILFSNEDHINKFNKYINSRHSNVRFKNVKEKDCSISFLDVLITRNNGFQTSVYRKKTFSGVYLNFDSYLPSIYKNGFIMCLLFSFVHICSNWNAIHKEISKLKGMLTLSCLRNFQK